MRGGALRGRPGLAADEEVAMDETVEAPARHRGEAPRIPPESVRATVMANALWPIFMAWRESRAAERPKAPAPARG